MKEATTGFVIATCEVVMAAGEVVAKYGLITEVATLVVPVDAFPPGLVVPVDALPPGLVVPVDALPPGLVVPVDALPPGLLVPVDALPPGLVVPTPSINSGDDNRAWSDGERVFLTTNCLLTSAE